MKKLPFLLLFLALSTVASAQQQYLITFKDKGPETDFYRQHPEQVLSAKALERRQKHQVAFKDEDLPISRTYLAQLQQNKAQVLQKSKWLNAMLVESHTDAATLYKLMPAIKSVKEIRTDAGKNKVKKTFELEKAGAANRLSYGQSAPQIEQLNLDCLHDQGYQGRNVLIAVFDTGYPGVDFRAAFDSIRFQNRIVATYDFVNGDTAVYHSFQHGTNVFSIISANQPGLYVGAATQASFALAITENMASETHQEELNWAAAAEWADSLGADIIQSSLNYRYFDAGQGDYTDADLDGNTAIITIAADKAAAKGILVVSSAGNDGNFTSPLSPLISPPADGDSVLTVGSVNLSNQYSSFSSRGPTADNRIKPDVVALGSGSKYITSSGSVTTNIGTSLATPLISGMAACLMQANPSATNMQVYQSIIRSADKYSNPNYQYGYGLPDACKADSLLKIISSAKALAKNPEVKIFPTITSDFIYIQGNAANVLKGLRMYAPSGQCVWQQLNLNTTDTKIDIRKLPQGLYLLQAELQHGWQTVKIRKQ